MGAQSPPGVPDRRSVGPVVIGGVVFPGALCVERPSSGRMVKVAAAGMAALTESLVTLGDVAPAVVSRCGHWCDPDAHRRAGVVAWGACSCTRLVLRAGRLRGILLDQEPSLEDHTCHYVGRARVHQRSSTVADLGPGEIRLDICLI